MTSTGAIERALMRLEERNGFYNAEQSFPSGGCALQCREDSEILIAAMAELTALRAELTEAKRERHEVIDYYENLVDEVEAERDSLLASRTEASQ